MDDFGSGYSSLNMLTEMPIDVLKLDMKFIHTEITRPSGQGILPFIVSMARWMKLSVVAEGVETGSSWSGFSLTGVIMPRVTTSQNLCLSGISKQY